MVETSGCPSIEELREFVSGRTPEPAPGLEPHLLECLDCARLTVELSDDDTVLSVFRGIKRPPKPAAEESALLDQMMSRFVALRNQDSATASSIDTFTSPDHDLPMPPGDLSRELGRGWRPAESADELGRFGDYRILKMLGSGGMGAVFLAEESQLRRLVALKVMRPGVAAEPEAAERFLLEARSAAALRSDHIVTIYQVGRVEDVPYVAMERLEGESLEQRLDRPPRLSTDEILRIGREIANGLALAHDRGLIHRDIKPANIWLEGKRGRVKLLDFGLVRATESDSRLTTSGAILGTPAYMSPEQACGEDVDHRTDLFSLGVTLYRMTTGEMPFKGKNSLQVLNALANVTPKPPIEVAPETPRALSDLITELLAKDREQRTATAELVNDRLALIESPPRANARTPNAKSSDNPPIKRVPNASGSGRGSAGSRWIWLGGFAFFAILLSVIWVVIKDRDGNPVAKIAVPPNGSVTVQPEESPSKPVQAETKAVAPTVPPMNVAKVAEGGDWNLPAGSPLPVVSPCSSEEASALQGRWAEFLKRPVVEENSLGMKFALIPPGEYQKTFPGSPESTANPETQTRRFRLTKPYSMSVTEVTWDQFRQFVDATGYKTEAETNGIGAFTRRRFAFEMVNWREPGWKPKPDEPVTMVTRQDSQAFCDWLSKQEEGGTIYRLPDEAEWQLACRAGSDRRFVFGDDANDAIPYAWGASDIDPAPESAPWKPVGKKRPNAFGLHDVLGNVMELTWDRLIPDLRPYLPRDNPRGAGEGAKFGMLGNPIASPDEVQPDRGVAGFDIGFRVLRQLNTTKPPSPFERPLQLQRGVYIAENSIVPRPQPIPGLTSWTLDFAAPAFASFAFHGFAASPGGDKVAIGDSEGRISIRTPKGQLINRLGEIGGEVRAAAFSPDGRWLAVVTDLQVCVWNTESGSLHMILSASFDRSCLSFSPDGSHLAVAVSNYSEPSLLIIDMRSGEVRRGHAPVYGRDGAAWSPKGDRVAMTTGESQRLQIWNVVGGVRKIREIEHPRSSVAWSPDGRSLAMRDGQGRLSIRDADSLELTATMGASLAYSEPIQWLPDGQHVVCHDEVDHHYGVALYDTVSRERVRRLGEGNFSLYDSGLKIALWAGDNLFFRDALTGELLGQANLPGRQSVNFPTLLCPDGSKVICGTWTYDAETGQPTTRSFNPTEGVLSDPSPDGKLLLRFSGGDSIDLLDRDRGTVVARLSHAPAKVLDANGYVSGAWTADGAKLATAGDDNILRVWDVSSGKLVSELRGHTDQVWSLAWSPDGKTLASLGNDNTLRLWDQTLITTIESFPEQPAKNNAPQTKLAWTADGRRLWVPLYYHIACYEIDTGRFGAMERFSDDQIVTRIIPSPDGNRLLVADNAGRWHLRAPDENPRKLLCQIYPWIGFRWHPDNRRGLSTSGLAYDFDQKRRLGQLFPLINDGWLCVGPTGHYRGSAGIEKHIIYRAQLDDGSQRMFTPSEFAEKFSWKNNPEKATLLKLNDE